MGKIQLTARMKDKIRTMIRRVNRLGLYPSCDHLNTALRFLIEDKPKELVMEEIAYAILKSNGYFYADIEDKVFDIIKFKRNE